MGIWTSAATSIAGLLGLLGLLGLCGMTWLFPAIARLTTRRHSRTGDSPDTTPIRISVLVPAYNEEKKIGRTLRSVVAACNELKSKAPESITRIHVASDGSTDRTAEIARAIGDVSVVEFPNRGKWRTLRALADTACRPNRGVSPQWIALADSGIEWPVDFLSLALDRLRAPNTLALAPTYRTPRAGLIENTVWSIERHFKTLETALGGPVSIHGATVLYRTDPFLRAIDQLGDGPWLNDDVVIPLTLRALYPDQDIVYAPDLAVTDRIEQEPGTRSMSGAYRRRRRLVLGNLQWITGVLPGVARANRSAAILALRRVFRVLWAYWGLSLGLALVVWVIHHLPITLGAGHVAGAALLATLGVLFATRVRAIAGLGASATASLLAPYYLISLRGETAQKDPFGQAAWK